MDCSLAPQKAVCKGVNSHQVTWIGCHPLTATCGLVDSLKFGAFSLDVKILTFLPTNGFSTKPLKVKLLAVEQKATELRYLMKPASRSQDTQQAERYLSAAVMMLRTAWNGFSSPELAPLFVLLLFLGPFVFQ